MASIQPVQARFGGNVCRACLNEAYRVHLEQTDCRYGYPYPARCPRCGEVRNIVTGLRPRAHWKLLFR